MVWVESHFSQKAREMGHPNENPHPVRLTILYYAWLLTGAQ